MRAKATVVFVAIALCVLCATQLAVFDDDTVKEEDSIQEGVLRRFAIHKLEALTHARDTPPRVARLAKERISEATLVAVSQSGQQPSSRNQFLEARALKRVTERAQAIKSPAVRARVIRLAKKRIAALLASRTKGKHAATQVKPQKREVTEVAKVPKPAKMTRAKMVSVEAQQKRMPVKKAKRDTNEVSQGTKKTARTHTPKLRARLGVDEKGRAAAVTTVSASVTAAATRAAISATKAAVKDSISKELKTLVATEVSRSLKEMHKAASALEKKKRQEASEKKNAELEAEAKKALKAQPQKAMHKAASAVAKTQPQKKAATVAPTKAKIAVHEKAGVRERVARVDHAITGIDARIAALEARLVHPLPEEIESTKMKLHPLQKEKAKAAPGASRQAQQTGSSKRTRKEVEAKTQSTVEASYSRAKDDAQDANAFLKAADVPLNQYLDIHTSGQPAESGAEGSFARATQDAQDAGSWLKRIHAIAKDATHPN